ncbi:MAG TPA: adenylate/guanylate cyclase domain-containing protein [Alphaproteobacteria bacterium]|nr:adenylate/guanylate cyclase domain-containing protein [Alphaproteobacteria bacterium]
MTDTVAAAQNAHLRSAFVKEELRSLRLVMYVRIAASAAIIAYLLLRFPSPTGIYWASLTVVFASFGSLQYLVARSRYTARWHKYVFVAIDLALVTFIIHYPNPFMAEAFPIAENFRFPNFDFLYVVVALMAFSYAPGVVAFAGLAAILAWGTGVYLALQLPGMISEYDVANFEAQPMAERLRMANGPTFIDIGARTQEFFIMAVTAGILATAVWRSKRLVSRQMRAERARTNLSRYFSPGMIDELADQDEPLGAVREQNVAVLFADIVGFTSLSENQPPEKVIALLRDFHSRMAGEVFAHGGTVDKYIGDAIMATFGTPRTGTRDATSALTCGRAMLEAVEAWNRERGARGESSIAVGIGLHFGPAVMGDIGDERRLEYAVIGDTVNVAARLETLTREIDAPLVVSNDTVEAVRRETGETAALAGLKKGETAAVRGRSGTVPVWTLNTAAAGGA